METESNWSHQRISFVFRAHGPTGGLWCIACYRRGLRYKAGHCPDWL